MWVSSVSSSLFSAFLYFSLNWVFFSLVFSEGRVMSPPAKNCRVKFRYVGLEKHSKLGGRKKSGITFLTGCTFSVPQWMKGAFLRLLIYHLWMHPRTISVHGMETWIQWTFITSLRSLWQRCFCAFRWQDDWQMMFNSSTYGGSFSQNLEDFDSIRSVLLYRSVALFNRLNLNCLHVFVAVLLWVQGGCVNTVGDLKNLVQVCRIRKN